MENENAWADNQYENLKKNTGTVCIKKKQVYIYSPSALSRRRKFRDSSTVEHAAVNRRVVGSNPTRGAKKRQKYRQVLLPFVFHTPVKHCHMPNSSEETEGCSLYILQPLFT